MNNVNTFIPMETEDREGTLELAATSSKRQKTNEASGSVQEQPEEEEKDLSQEDLQQMTIVVPVEEVYVEALQVNIQSLTGRFTLKNPENIRRSSGDDLVMLWNLLKERFSSTEPTDDKERALRVDMKRLLVEQHSEMANELLKKIFIQANRTRQ
ncbi:hypothetical protein Tco_0028309 [Tanacetum coccineum]